MAHPRHSADVYRRRRLAALGVLAAAAAIAGAAVGAGDRSRGDGPPPASKGVFQAEKGEQAQLPLGGRRIFPDFRVVAFYGAPQSHALGALGIGSPDHAARRLAREARPYARRT